MERGLPQGFDDNFQDVYNRQNILKTTHYRQWPPSFRCVKLKIRPGHSAMNGSAEKMTTTATVTACLRGGGGGKTPLDHSNDFSLSPSSPSLLFIAPHLQRRRPPEGYTINFAAKIVTSHFKVVLHLWI